MALEDGDMICLVRVFVGFDTPHSSLFLYRIIDQANASVSDLKDDAQEITELLALHFLAHRYPAFSHLLLKFLTFDRILSAPVFVN